jgi:hypothetical protein
LYGFRGHDSEKKANVADEETPALPQNDVALNKLLDVLDDDADAELAAGSAGSPLVTLTTLKLRGNVSPPPRSRFIAPGCGHGPDLRL